MGWAGCGAGDQTDRAGGRTEGNERDEVEMELLIRFKIDDPRCRRQSVREAGRGMKVRDV